jgi:hypothetical protein
VQVLEPAPAAGTSAAQVRERSRPPPVRLLPDSPSRLTQARIRWLRCQIHRIGADVISLGFGAGL